ncbi:MAG: FAD-linked oxidase C-terminal domain-containing protein, partial [Anaerolineales bacterium]
LRPAPTVHTRYAAFLSAALDIREKYAETIKANWPMAWRNSAGYRLNYLLPWSATHPPQWTGGAYPPVAPDAINLAKLLAGSEGTLAVIRAATVNLVRKPKHTILGVLSYESVAAACDAVPGVLERSPSAVELIPQMLIRLARSVQAAAGQLGFVQGDPGALLVVEFSGDDPALLREKVRALGNLLGGGNVVVAESAAEQANVWAVRKMGLGIVDSRPTLARPLAFIEDCAIPVERLGEFVREVERILSAHGTEAAFYAHASAGTLHIRPMLNLKTEQGARALRSIAEQVLALTLSVGGAMSSEHGDGLLRSEWLPQTYGAELVEAMKSLKRAADPDSLLSPQKLTDAPPMDTHLRYGPAYQARAWTPALDFTREGGLARAVEQCNGQGVCRKDSGVMCPSFQATREEQNVTRGRSNLLRALISLPQAAGGLRPADVKAALDLCLACKGCTAECPSGVDMPKLKYEFMNEYYKTHARSLRDYLFGYFHVAAALLSPVAPLANVAMQNPLFKALAARIFDLAPQRSLPLFVGRAAQARVKWHGGRQTAILLPDVLSRYIEPQVEQAVFDALDLAGFDTRALPVIGAGAALLSKGMIAPARRHAAHVLDELARLDPQVALPLVGVEPSEVYTLKNDYIWLLPARADEIERRAAKTWLVEEWLVRSGALEGWRALGAGRETSAQRMTTSATSAQPSAPLKLHPHCHQRAEAPADDGLPNGVNATLEMLRACGYSVDVLDTGCCGMAGTFGFDAEHYELSMRVGALQVFPQVKAAGDAGIVSTGAACRMQIAHGTGVTAEHPLVLAVRALKGV